MESYSGSLQSSSGGGSDEENDSRAAAASSSSPSPFSSFLNLPPQHHQPNTPMMFDQSLSSYRFHNQNQNPFLNLDMLIWPSSKSSSEQNPHNILPSSSSSPIPQTLISSPALVINNSIIRPSSSLPQTTSSSATSAAGLLVPPIRNLKKRSRASRRAPTTVLTTDTTNFKAMVQEFTGIPPPPFSSSSHFPIMMTSGNYNIVRPFAHKMQTPSLLLPQHQQDQHQQRNTFSSSTVNTSNMGGASNLGSSNYQMNMNHNHHLGDSELGHMINLYSLPNTNSSHPTNILGSSTSTTRPSNDRQFGLGSLTGRNVDLSSQHGLRRNENDVNDFNDWEEVGVGSQGRPDVS